MINKINIAELELDNSTVRESVVKALGFLEDASLSTIGEISMDAVMLSQHNESVKEAIDALDHTIIDDVDILKAAEANSLQRKHEVEDHDFFFEFVKRLDRDERTVYIVGKTEDEVKQIGHFLAENHPKVAIVGMSATDYSTGEDAIINDINAANPNVILSMLPTLEQLNFIHDYRGMLLANVWYGFANTKFTKRKTGLLARIKSLLSIKRLTKSMNKKEE